MTTAVGFAQQALESWYDQERPPGSGQPERNVVCAGLAVLERTRKVFPLQRHDYITDGNQVRTSGSLIKTILRRYGIGQNYASEGGRTTRGTVPAAERLVTLLNQEERIAAMSQAERNNLIDALQEWLASKVKDYFDRQRIEIEVKIDRSGPQIVGEILAAANRRGSAGPVAQHLVGAKLALRYPSATIDNHSYTTADVQLGRRGDFMVNDTVFHVTVSPMPAVMGKCAVNVRAGFRAMLLVSESKMAAARQMAETASVVDGIGILSIESFIGQNIEEIGEFSKTGIATGFRRLLTEYNRRVAEVETNQSLQIEIPQNL